jgi:hypothetical protein
MVVLSIPPCFGTSRPARRSSISCSSSLVAVLGNRLTPLSPPMREVRVAELLVPPDLLLVKELSLEPNFSLKKINVGPMIVGCKWS